PPTAIAPRVVAYVGCTAMIAAAALVLTRPPPERPSPHALGAESQSAPAHALAPAAAPTLPASPLPTPHPAASASSAPSAAPTVDPSAPPPNRAPEAPSGADRDRRLR